MYLSISETVRKTVFNVKPSCCGNELDEPGAPCPSCGSTNRPWLVPGKLTITIPWAGSDSRRARLAAQALVVDDDWCRDLNKQVKRERLFDRVHNQYHERVTAPDTQQVIHECKEPLSEHSDHAFAKRNHDKE